jgi:hypothetical protein
VCEAQYSRALLLSIRRTFARTEENDGAGGKLGYAMSDAANQVAIQPSETACREHNGIALRVSCRSNYLFRRLTHAYLEVRSHNITDIVIGKSAQTIRCLPLQ